MKKLKLALCAAILAMGFSSCVVYQTHTVTGNPIGTKKAVVKANAFNSDAKYTIQAAAKKGKIDKIGSVDTKVTVFIIPFYKTVVTGE